MPLPAKVHLQKPSPQFSVAQKTQDEGRHLAESTPNWPVEPPHDPYQEPAPPPPLCPSHFVALPHSAQQVWTKQLVFFLLALSVFSMAYETIDTVKADLAALTGLTNVLNGLVAFLMGLYIAKCLNRWWELVYDCLGSLWEDLLGTATYTAGVFPTEEPRDSYIRCHILRLPHTFMRATLQSTTLHNPPQPSTALHNPPQPFTTLQNPSRFTTTLYSPSQPSETLYSPSQPSTALHNAPEPFTTHHNLQPSTTLHNSPQPATLHNPLQPAK